MSEKAAYAKDLYGRLKKGFAPPSSKRKAERGDRHTDRLLHGALLRGV